MERMRQTRRTRCPLHVGRRNFLKSAGASALALKMGLFDFASELFAQEAPAAPAAQPVVHVLFLRPNVDRYWMGWPGASYDVPARQAQYTQTLTEAAQQMGVRLEVHAQPLHNLAGVNTFLGQVRQSPPDGIIAILMAMSHWGHANHLVANKGDVPTVVFSPMGTSFTGHLQATRNAPRTFVGATQEVGWLRVALRMLKTICDMRQSRICVCRGNTTADRRLDVIGTTLHYIPRGRFPEELRRAETTDQMRQIAQYYRREAQAIREPNEADILAAAKNYVVARLLMRSENCHGFSMDCLGLVASRQAPPPCIAFMRLNDEGSVGACEADWNAAISLRLNRLLNDRPGFMQDPAPNSVNNTLMGAHCSCPSRLDGFERPHAPFILRSHSESNIGVAPQVLWRIGQRTTIMKFQGPSRIIVGTGRVVRNIDTPPSGGCRNSVELELDDVADARDARGFHQLFIYGDLERQFRAYCQLAGIRAEHI